MAEQSDELAGSVVVGAQLCLPTGTTLYRAESGADVGFILPDGSIIRPWLQFERTPTLGDDPVELSHDELATLGVTYEYDRNDAALLDPPSPAVSPDLWVWGTNEEPTQAAIAQSVVDFCVEELANAKHGLIIGPDGRQYDVALTARLVPVNNP